MARMPSGATKHTDEQTVERWVAAGTAHDLEGLRAIASPDIEVFHSGMLLPAGTTYHGHDGLRTMVEQSVARMQGVTSELLACEALDGWTVATVRIMRGEDSTERTVLFDIRDGRVRRLHSYATREEALEEAGGAELTPREREILELLGRGLTAPQVAERLVLSPTTVRTHVQNAMIHLGAKTRVQAIALAVERGEIDV